LIYIALLLKIFLLPVSQYQQGVSAFSKKVRTIINKNNMSGRLTGKVAIVTGASAGIGKATALAPAAEGAQLVLTARWKERLEESAAAIDAPWHKNIGYPRRCT
jgi:NADP-dependent 3-hydroxy acid dehydrogenase YdfG